ncbi:MAG TPA: RagB/SusD family nutrient uptake outer membrane protein [Saprospiraceae bacterium]|nr:RagB/SusD family nutrient uptake outer membrane protein [Saprospiraceae bacterium]
MKNRIRIYILALLALSASACRDFLTEDPVTFYSEQTIFSNEEGVETAINGIFSAYQTGQYYGTAWHNLTMPLSGKFYSSQVANRDAVSLNTTSSNQWVSDMWAQMYTTINTANTAIANLETTEAPLANRTRALGDAYFLRGITYLDLVRLFGGVPLRTKPVKIADIHQPRASRQAVIELVISDLEKAKTMMSAPADARRGRPSRLAANVYLAKLYMTLAGEENGDASYWAKAKTELMEVYQSGAYSLTPTYAELFHPGNENTRESIFELQYGHTGGIRNSDIVRSFTPSNSIYAPSNTSTFGRIRPNKETYDQHLGRYPGDPRLAATFIAGSYARSTGGNQTIYPTRKTGTQGFAVIAKWFDPSYNGTTTERNLIQLRYADVLLMLAEVENELSGPETAYPFVNQVLARARDTNGDGVSDTMQPADWSGMTQADFRTWIMRERMFELLSEGQEWFDTRRRGYDFFLQEVVMPHNAHPFFDATTDFMYPDSRKNMLLPIPLSEISGNQAITNADQNPGY